METKTKKLEVQEIKEGYSFKEQGHSHYLDGKALTGVTTILGVLAKPALIQWAANEVVGKIKSDAEVILEDGKTFYEITEELLEEARFAHRKKKEEAGEKGTDVHSQIEQIIKEAIKLGGLIPPILKTALAQIEGNEQLKHFVDWAVKNKIKFLDSEVHIYSRKLWLGGICDFVCEIDKEVWIGDIKTGNGIHPEHFFQTAGYQILFEEMKSYPKIKGHLIVNLKKDGTFEEKRSISNEDNKNAFLSALNLYRVMEKIKGQIINK